MGDAIEYENEKLVNDIQDLLHLAEEDKATIATLRAQLAEVTRERDGLLRTYPAPSIGDYVLATKYADGDPGDAWALGFCSGQNNDRHFVVDGEGRNIRGNGFRQVARIREDVGRWLLANARALEESPPGTVNLWKMLAPPAFDVEEPQP